MEVDEKPDKRVLKKCQHAGSPQHFKRSSVLSPERKK
jgi:hypothetical protein